LKNKDSYNTLILGAGNIAALFDSPEDKNILTHAHAFQSSGAFHLLGFYDVDEEKARAAAKRWGVQAFSSLSEALSKAEVVCVCVPDAYHYATLKELGAYPLKLVITEKPLCQREEEAKEIEKLYENSPCIVNYSRRYLKEFESLRNKVKSYGRFLKGNGYYGKGILHNGSHMIDLLQYLLGPVCGFDKPENKLCDFEEDISCDVRLLFQEGSFRMNSIDSRVVTIFELDLFFEKARVRILDGGTRLEIYTVQPSPTYEGYFNYLLEKEEQVDYSHAMTGLVENAKEVLEGKAKPKCSLQDAKQVLEWCLRIRGDLD
jgi:predicted dehydrogenase